MTDDATESTIRVIQKLLSRGGDRLRTRAEACLAKVAELMARHSIEEAVLRGPSRGGGRRGTGGAS
ncbi:MAG: hypothetical protein R2716_03605 [Microthrixaceae bacterium]